MGYCRNFQREIVGHRQLAFPLASRFAVQAELMEIPGVQQLGAALQPGLALAFLEAPLVRGTVPPLQVGQTNQQAFRAPPPKFQSAGRLEAPVVPPWDRVKCSWLLPPGYL